MKRHDGLVDPIDFVRDFHADLTGWFSGSGDRDAIWARFEETCPPDMTLVYPSGTKMGGVPFLESIRDRFGRSPGFEAMIVEPEIVVETADHAVVAYAEVQTQARESDPDNHRSALAVLLRSERGWRWRYIQETSR